MPLRPGCCKRTSPVAVMLWMAPLVGRDPVPFAAGAAADMVATADRAVSCDPGLLMRTPPATSAWAGPRASAGVYTSVLPVTRTAPAVAGADLPCEACT